MGLEAMFCKKCGNQIEYGHTSCSKCGFLVENGDNKELQTEKFQNNLTNSQQNFQVSASSTTINSESKNKLIYVICALVCIVFVILSILVIGVIGNKSVYFSNQPNDTSNIDDDTNEVSDDSMVTIAPGKTSVVFDNYYPDAQLKTAEEAIDLIIKDSQNEKKKCKKTDIVEIENRISKNYGITAVNLCELNKEFALEVEGVVKIIHDKYPTARKYLTNLTLVNASMSEGYIAAFYNMFKFAESNSTDTYPWGFKTLIGLNSAYFLNTKRLDLTVADASKTGHFPKNATRYSVVAHEFGHYLSFLAARSEHGLDSVLLANANNTMAITDLATDMKDGKNTVSMIEEAFSNYQKKYNDGMTILQFRQSISGYAVTKNNDGDFIYDETIAEAFHDYYLNGDSAAKASIEVVLVLNSRLENL